MSQHVLDPISVDSAPAGPHRQRHHPDETLVLSELPSDAVIDHLDDDAQAIELITFGTVRECCPTCKQSTGKQMHLKLVLRQRKVRLAHLFCAECQRCFDAHYTNGKSALTI